MPCCDSLNTVSPRFFAEIFNKTSPGGKFLSIDSSVFTVLTPDDPSLPRDLVFDPDGKERFRKYIPFPSFVNTIENYPYPYVIGGSAGSFPASSPATGRARTSTSRPAPKRWKTSRRPSIASCIKQGVFNLVFHPHGWIKPEQVVELIDHAVKKHGKKVKFLNFREAHERLNKNLLGADAATRREPTPVSAWSMPTATVISSRAGRDRPTADPTCLPVPGSSTTRAATPAFASSTSTKTASSTSFSRTIKNMGSTCLIRRSEGLDAQGHGGQGGRARALPKIVRDGTNNGFFVHSRQLWWQNEDTAKLPNLVDRRSFNELLKDVEPRGKSPEASLEVDPGRARLHGRAGRRRAAGQRPDRLRLGGRRQALGRRDGRLPAGNRRQGQARRRRPVPRRHRRRRPLRQGRRPSWTASASRPASCPGGTGVLVACAPDIFYAEDRDGDGKADHREVLFTGFGEGNQQHRLNGFELGLDGWVYGANGDSGGSPLARRPGKSTSISGRDFRFRPDTGEFEAESGQTQYGRHRDDWGHWFGNNNPNWGWHYVLAESRPQAQPIVRPARPAADARARHPALSDQPHARPVQRPGRGQPRHLGQQPDALPRRPLRPRVRHQPVRQRAGAQPGASDGARAPGRDLPRPSRAGRGRTASSSPRATTGSGPRCSRPAPTGHSGSPTCIARSSSTPNGFPTTGKQRLDLRAGSEQGRIYRVYPGRQEAPADPAARQARYAGLVAALDSPSGWQRDTAQRLLLHRRDPAAIAPLRALAIATKRPKTRVQAIWTLADLGGLDEPSVLAGLEDPDPRVRESVIAAAWPPGTAVAVVVADALLRLADDADAHVRFQVALALGNCDEPPRRRGPRATGAARWERPVDAGRDLELGGPSRRHAAARPASRRCAGPGNPRRRGDPRAALEPGGLAAESGSDRADHAHDRRAGGAGGRYAPWQFAMLAGLLDARDHASDSR